MKKVEKILKMEMEKVFQRYGYRIKEIDSGCFPSKLLIFNNYITLAGQPSVFSYMGKRRSQKKEENYWILRHTDFLIRVKGEDFTEKKKENLRKAYQNILRIEMKEGFLRIPYTAKKYDEKAVIKSRYSEREINYSPFIVDIVLPEEVTVEHLSEMYEKFFEDELFSGKYHSFMEVHFEEKIKEKYQASRQITIGSLRLDLSDGHAYLNNADTGLTRTEFSLLRLLAENQEKIFSAKELYEAVWGSCAGTDTSTVRRHIFNLRTKIGAEDTDEYDIVSVYGKGYLFTCR